MNQLDRYDIEMTYWVRENEESEPQRECLTEEDARQWKKDIDAAHEAGEDIKAIGGSIPNKKFIRACVVRYVQPRGPKPSETSDCD